MGRINISFAAVSQKTGKLKVQTEQSLLSNIMERYDNLQGSLEQSSGMGMDAIREEIEQEKKTVEEVGRFMIELLSFIQESSDAFEHVDVNHEEVMKQFI